MASTAPLSYADLPLQELRCTHHPASSKTVTPIIIVELYRPKKYNSFTSIMTDEIIKLWGTLSTDDRVKCIILTGQGRMFCAGADLDQGFGERGMLRVKDHRDIGGKAVLAIHHCTKPTIAAINGAAVGVGITMTLPCAIRVARSDAKIGFVFGRRGLVMEACSSFFLPRLIGYSRALRACTTGEVSRADSKMYDGLFAEVVECKGPESTEVLEKALELARDIVANVSVVSAYLMREMMWRGTGWSAEEAHLTDSGVIAGLFGKGDNLEGVKAFLEKRQVNFQGTLAKDAPESYPWWPQVDTTTNIMTGPHRLNSQAKL